MYQVTSSPSIVRWFLALDTSTEFMSLGLSEDRHALQKAENAPLRPAQSWLHTAAGANQSSSTLIPAIMRLLEQAGLSMQQLEAIVVGVGPGSFTGLRVACAVAQGLALGAGLRILPVSTLLAVAEDWRHRHAAHDQQGQVWSLLDARMEEIYAACWHWQTDHEGLVQWQCLHEPVLVAPENLLALPELNEHANFAGNVQCVYEAKLPLPTMDAWPKADAMLRLAPTLLQQGCAAVDPALVLPSYVRDKVAQTIAERAATQNATPLTN